MTWNEYKDYRGSCLVYESINYISKIKPNKIEDNKILALSLEWNLIKPTGLGFWISNLNDWNYCYDMEQLVKYKHKNYTIAMFSNQTKLGVEGHLTLNDFKNLIKRIDIDLNIPFQLFVSTSNGYFKKPVTGLWEIFLKLNGIYNIHINHKKSIYVGQQAGRKLNSYNKKDNSSVDYYFSQNISLKFKTPEQFFLKSKKARHMRLPLSFHPKLYLCDNAKYDDELETFKTLNKQHIVILVGSPASGKSRICKKYLNNHIRINQDTLKTVAKCFKKAKMELEKGNSIVVDNTNRNRNIREKWINLAKDYQIPIDCIYVDIIKNMALHFNSFRNLSIVKGKVPDIAIYSYFSKLEPPSQDEGFRYFIRLNVDSDFDDKYTQAILSNYIRDKYDASHVIDILPKHNNDWETYDDIIKLKATGNFDTMSSQ